VRSGLQNLFTPADFSKPGREHFMVNTASIVDAIDELEKPYFGEDELTLWREFLLHT